MESKDTTKERGGNLTVDFLIASVLVVIAFILRWINYAEVSAYPDEFYYSAFSYSIISEGWSWPVRFMVAQPPLFPYILSILTCFFGGGLEVFRMVSVIFGSLTIWIMYFLGKELFDRRVGVLSAVLLTFSGFHILYSKIAMLEAILIFFSLAFIYYFSKSLKRKNDFKSSFFCGIFFGLACITKLYALLLFAVFFITLLWVKKNIRTVFEKQFLLILLTSIAILLPVWIDLYLNNVNPIYWQLFQSSIIGGGIVSLKTKSYGIIDLLIRGFKGYIDLIIDGSRPAALSLPWLSILYYITSFLFVLTVLYYIYLELKGKSHASVLFIFFIIFNTFFAYFSKRNEYYLLSTLPVFILMLSSVIFSFSDMIKEQDKTSIKFFAIYYIRKLTLVFAGIFIFSVIIIGARAPLINNGDFHIYEKYILKIEDSLKSGDSIATDWAMETKYYLDKHISNSQEISLIKLYSTKNFKKEVFKLTIDKELLRTVKPRYIIIRRFYYDSSFTKNDGKMFINEDYDLISDEDEVLLFERKINLDDKQQNVNEQTKSQDICPGNEISGMIYHDIFSRQIPVYMTIGERYNGIIKIKNTGNSKNSFLVTLDVSDKSKVTDEFIYAQNRKWTLSLDEGESQWISYTIVPIKPHIGTLNTKIKLSSIKSPFNCVSSFNELDNVSAPVLSIKKAFSMEYIITYTGIIIMFICATGLIMKIFK